MTSRPCPLPAPSRFNLDRYLLLWEPFPSNSKAGPDFSLAGTAAISHSNFMRLPEAPSTSVTGSAAASEEMRLLLLRRAVFIKEMGSESSVFVVSLPVAEQDETVRTAFVSPAD